MGGACLINFHSAHTARAEATKTPFYANFCKASESQNAKKNKNINDLPMYNPYKWHNGGWLVDGDVVLELDLFPSLTVHRLFHPTVMVPCPGLSIFGREWNVTYAKGLSD